MFASHMIAIKSTLNWSETTCNETTLWINWTPFEMADELPSCNCWFSSQQSVYMASNPKKKCKSWQNIVKNHLGRANFVLFSNLFHPVVSKLKQDSCHKVHAIYIYCFILIFFPFSFIYVQIECEILSQKFSITDRFPLSLDTEWKKCYWWNLKF